MDLQWSEADRAFQHEVRAFIEAAQQGGRVAAHG